MTPAYDEHGIRHAPAPEPAATPLFPPTNDDA